MPKRFLAVTIALSATVAFLLGLVASGTLVPAAGSIQTVVARPPIDAAHTAALAARPVVAIPGGVDFADIAAELDDAVVNIAATSMSQETRPARRFRRTPDGGTDPPDGDDPGVPQRGAGSGFIIDPEGYILTNHHVIEGAERIVVTLADGRSFRAALVGTDPAIDVALIKVTAPARFPVAPLGDSDSLRVGEWVCAIGNPLGYVHSVTVGVVSFIGRKLFDPSLDDYIQTDAAINYGNSGGPLINARGEVIGINSAISRRANNIGFAIPINQAVDVLPQLRTRGRVSRGYIGVRLITVTPDLQRSLGLATSAGALVLEVENSSPGERAGLKVYDLILSVDDREVANDDELIREISLHQPGSTVVLRVLRDDRARTMPVKLAERPATDEPAGADASERSEPAAEDPGAPAGQPTLGLSVRELDDTFARRFGIPASVRGMVVSRVDTAGPGYAADLRRGFVIMEVNRRPVRTVAEFERQIAATRPGDVVALLVYNPMLSARDLVAVTVDELR